MRVGDLNGSFSSKRASIYQSFGAIIAKVKELIINFVVLFRYWSSQLSFGQNLPCKLQTNELWFQSIQIKGEVYSPPTLIIQVIIKQNHSSMDQKQKEYSRYFKIQIDDSFRGQAVDVTLSDRYQQGGMDNDDAQYLAKKHCPTLRIINLQWNNFTDLGMKYLSTVKWQNLRNIELGIIGNIKVGTEQTQNDAKYIANSNWSHLQKLFLCHNQIDDSGIIHLTKRSWRQLKQFSIRGNFLEDDGLKYLIRAKWSNITYFNVSHNRFTEIGAYKVVLFDGKLTHIRMVYEGKLSKEKVRSAINSRYILEGEVDL